MKTSCSQVFTVTPWVCRLFIMGILVSLAQSLAVAQEPTDLRGPSFVPDTRLDGASMNGLHTLGGAQWNVENGEFVGKGTTGGGWLVLDKALQDVGVYTAFRCSGPCDTGILVRMARAASGSTGTYLSLKGKELEAFALTVDANGGVVSQEKLRDRMSRRRYRRY
jgi:hypothetical protein